MSVYKNALLFVKNDSEKALQLVDTVSQKLQRAGLSAHRVEGEYSILADFDQKQTIAIVLGGDGTYLATACKLYEFDIPVLGINLGNLGFLTEFDPDKIDKCIDDIVSGNVVCEKRPYYTLTLERDGKNLIEAAPFLNDAVAQRDGQEKMLNFSIYVGGRLVTSSRADGLIISSPTGSTAYNLSAGGPIVDPSLDALVLSPICPHTLSFRPVVVPAYQVKVIMERSRGQISLDGRNSTALMAGDELFIQKAPKMLKLIRPKGLNFFELLRQKLHWK